MSSLGEQLDKYINRITDAEDKEEWRKVINLCKEYTNALNVLLEADDDPLNQKHYFIIRSSVAVVRRVASQALKQEKINKDVDKEMDKLRIDLNNALGRIKRIEEAKGFDNPEKMT